MGDDKKKIQDDINAIVDQEKLLQIKITDEKDVRKAWAIENVRRQHSYIPFVFNLLKILAEKDKLKELREEGKKKMEEREQKKKEEEKKKNEKAKTDQAKAGQGKDTTDKSKGISHKS